MRGLAAAIMLQGHVLEGWVRVQDRWGEWFWLSQFLGGLPAPIFFFLVGVSLSLVTDKMRAKDLPLMGIVRTVLRRSGWILLLAYAFRLQQYLAWYPYSSWDGIFKVDTLNCIGLSMLFLGLLSLPFRNRRTNAVFMGILAGLVVFLTPFLYPIRIGTPSLLHTYFNGAGHADYFSVIPWIAFPLCGMTFGYLLLDARARAAEHRFFQIVAATGILAYGVGSAMSLSPIFEYGFFDYSLTSPHFFFIRLGLLLLIFYGSYRWSIRRTAYRWSPLRTFGQASLLVYWIHIEIVYGRLAHYASFSRGLSIEHAAVQLVWLIPVMLLLAMSSRWREGRDYVINWSRGWLFAPNSVEPLPPR